MNWPSPTVLRRWMRRPGFIRGMAAIQKTLQFRSDFELSGVAATAGSRLASLLADEPKAEQRVLVQSMANLIKLSHMRQRFPTLDDPQPNYAFPNILSILATVHPSVSANRAYELVMQRLNCQDEKSRQDEQDLLEYDRARKALGTKLTPDEREGHAF